MKKVSGIQTPPALRIARNILAAHYGSAEGDLTWRLTRNQGYVVSPKLSLNGKFTYVIGHLGSPAALADSSEVSLIRELFKEYCPDEPVFNFWLAPCQILHQTARKISARDLERLERFIRNNGGQITDSESVIGFVIASLQTYLANTEKPHA